MVKVDFQLLILSWIEVVAVFTLKTTTQWTILWRPFIVPGLYYEKLESSNNQPDSMKGSTCLDMCEEAFFHGPRICRYLMIEPLQADWDKPITRTIDFVDRVRDMRVKNCYLFEAQKLEGDLAEKFFISKGFRNPFNKEQGTHITLEFVAEAYQSWMWPNPFDDVVVPDHFEMEPQTAQYFENTGACPWNPDTNAKIIESTSTITTATSVKTTTEEPSSVILYSMNCGVTAAHSFGNPKCPNMNDTPQILYESKFSTVKEEGCSMVPVLTTSWGALMSSIADETRAQGWCSTQKACGYETGLAGITHTVNGFTQSTLYVSSNDTAKIICYVRSSIKP